MPRPTRRLLLCLAAGTATCLVPDGPRLRAQTAFAGPLGPWDAAPAARDPDWRVRAAAWGVLAPNPHNRQPWVLELAGADTALLRCEPARRLPVTDPFDRQITIGLGAFAELFRMAAAAEGQEVAIEPFPEGEARPRLDARPVARLRRTGRPAAPDPLFAHALARRSAKRPFDPARPPGEAALADLAAAAGAAAGFGATLDPVEVAALRDLTWRAWTIELETPAAHGESVGLMRLGGAEVAARPDGISLWGPGIDPLVAEGAITREGFATPGHPAWQAMTDRYRAMLAATAAYVWSTSAGDSRAEAFSAGRHWLRLNLAATGLGLALHPVSQALQEYPAMAGPFAAIHRRLGVAAPGRVQMLGRIGHLPAAEAAPPPTPRWPVESRILRA